MTEWNEENIKEHMFTEVEVSDNGGPEWMTRKLSGYCLANGSPFMDVDGDEWEQMRLIPEKPKSLEITEGEYNQIVNNGGRVFVNRFNQLVKLVEEKL